MALLTHLLPSLQLDLVGFQQLHPFTKQLFVISPRRTNTTATRRGEREGGGGGGTVDSEGTRRKRPPTVLRPHQCRWEMTTYIRAPLSFCSFYFCAPAHVPACKSCSILINTCKPPACMSLLCKLKRNKCRVHARNDFVRSVFLGFWAKSSKKDIFLISHSHFSHRLC